jgi:hypothetical protein
VANKRNHRQPYSKSNRVHYEQHGGFTNTIRDLKRGTAKMARRFGFVDYDHYGKTTVYYESAPKEHGPRYACGYSLGWLT